jgi:hypothetical protein
MSTELYLDTPDYDSAWELANHFARLISVEWEGREITLKDAEALRDEVERRIIELFETIRPDSQIYNHIAATLAWIGSSPENRLLLEREIDQLIRLPDGRYVGAGWFKKMGKKIGHGISKACDKVGEFWEEHKTAIIIGAVVVTAVVVVVVVATCTGGAGAEAAIAAGCAALDQLAKSDTSTPQQQQPSVQHNQPAPTTVKENQSNPTLTQAPAPISISLSMDSNPISKPAESTFSQMPSQLQVDLQPFTATSPFQAATPANPLLPPPKPSSGVMQSVALGDPTNYQTDTRKPAVTYSNPSPVANCSQGLVIAGPDTFTRVVPIPYENRTSNNPVENLYPKPDFNSFSTPQNITPTVETAIAQTDQSTVKASYDKFASKALKGEAFADFQSPPPFGVLPIVGESHQGTIHALGGIANSDESTMESANCLYNTLGEEFAIQPHRLHSNNIVEGACMVGLEKLKDGERRTGFDSLIPPFLDFQGGLNLLRDYSKPIAETILQNSKIQDSIDYTVEHLTRSANEIIAMGNPNKKQMYVPFSNGGHVSKEALKRLTPEQRDTIIIFPIGTTDIIEDCWAHLVINIIGDKDWPSINCNGGIDKIMEKSSEATILMIPQNETKLGVSGHYFVQPEYQEEIQRLINLEIKGVYEIY